MHQLDSIYRRVYLGLNYRLRNFAGGRYAASCRPTSIVILLTERCNARCIHCDIWKTRGVESSPGLEGWQTVLKDLRAWLGPVPVVISGGEALLKKYAVELLEYGCKLGLFMELLTNGFWDDQSRFEKIALANPGRVTFSFDGIGEAHNLIRGRENFFDKTSNCIRTLTQVRDENRLNFAIRLKTVVMEQNLNDVCKVAEYAAANKLEVFYQPIEQNYNTEEDPTWFERSETWPRDADRAVAVVEELIQLKQRGFPIANSSRQLEAMVPYFRDPARQRVATQSHSAHEKQLLCSALTTLQIQANGGVTVCTRQREIGNITETPIREIWENRPQFWSEGCCLVG